MLRISRGALYELIWAKPMTEIAALYGVRDIALAKACDFHDVPRPRPGHWQKLAHGKAVVQPPLDCKRFAADAVIEVASSIWPAVDS